MTWPSIWENLNIFTQGCFVPSKVEMTQCFWRRKFVKFVISLLSPLGKDEKLHLNNLDSLYSRMPCAKFGWKWHNGSEEDFFISSINVRLFVIIFPWKRAGLFIWTNINSLHPRMLCAKFVGTWWFWRRRQKSLRRQQRRQRRTTNKLWSEKLTWPFRSDKLTRGPIGHIAHMRNQYKSMNTFERSYDYIL